MLTLRLAALPNRAQGEIDATPVRAPRPRTKFRWLVSLMATGRCPRVIPTAPHSDREQQPIFTIPTTLYGRLFSEQQPVKRCLADLKAFQSATNRRFVEKRGHREFPSIMPIMRKGDAETGTY